METIESRLSRLEAVQHITLGLISAVMSALRPLNPDMQRLIEHHLEEHHAHLLAESANEVKVQAFQELRALLLPGDASST